MKSILKKVAGVALAAVLALGMIGCSNGSDDPVMPPVISSEIIPEGFVKVKGGTVVGKKNTNNYDGVFIEGRTVTLSDFYMSKYEVTKAQYKAIYGRYKP